ncbi:MAG: peptide deformylase [Deltaproteobacteria bacterium RIFCSPLOWO2_02_FULL_44_10]|nr:MAG: peptide deformylase [Deltaproteobacteria bacterium RIFCSPHIGHO2_02_FULL_44_16]OGQ47720.1 MAG: peptide deformylase [Deltaproteobacteria bacterium RIFCSPLOWO2_02_FULL_44_10]
MTVLNIEVYPAPVLRKKAAKVKEVTEEIRLLLDDMAETMYAAPGVGLAAPQVGISHRVIVCDPNREEQNELYQMINPEIIERKGEIEWEEGCLSLPGFLTMMKRSERVTCIYLDPQGKEHKLQAEGLLAIIIQHEIDHLDGKLILDSVSTLKQELYANKLKKGKLE